jgi:glycine oxidase
LIVVIGGGISGAFAAYFLARQGIAATIVDREDVGAQASGNNPGGLNPLHGPGIPGPMEAASLFAFRLHLEHLQAIRDLSGVNAELRFPVRIHVAMDRADEGLLETVRAMHDRHAGFSARWISRSELLALEPRLSPGVRRGLWTQGSARVEAAVYTRAVLEAAIALGARTIKAQAIGIEGRNRLADAAVTDAGTVPCDGVIVATGAWVDGPAAWLGASIPVEPVKGELLHVEIEPPLEYEIVWRDAAAYGDGRRRACLGGTRARAGFDTAPTAAGRASILAGVQAFLPGLKEIRIVGHSAALRPVAVDQLPIVGFPRGWDNVCLALGAGHKGMLLGASMGRLAADLQANGGAADMVEAWLPGRFEGPPLSGR